MKDQWVMATKHAGHFKPAGQEPRRGKGGRRPGAGGPRKADLRAKEEMLTVWEREIKKREEKLAKLYVKRAFKSDRVLLDLRKTRLADMKQEIEIEHKGKISSTVIIETVDPHGMGKK